MVTQAGRQLNRAVAARPRPAGVIRLMGRLAWLMAGLWLAACAGAAGPAPALTAPPAQPLPATIVPATAIAGLAATDTPGAAATNTPLAATIGPVPTDTLAATAAPATGAPTASAPTALAPTLSAPTTAAPTARATAPNGCPEQQGPSSAGSTPDVVLGGPNGAPGGSANLAVGQVLEVRLQAGLRWSLALPGAAGVLAPADHNGWYAAQPPECVWRFTGRAPGTVTLDFSGIAICPRGTNCPQFILESNFEVTVKG